VTTNSYPQRFKNKPRTNLIIIRDMFKPNQIGCFLAQETLPSLLSTGLFQE